MSNIYDIINKLNSLEKTHEVKQTANTPVYENIKSQGDIMKAVKQVEQAKKKNEQ